MIEIEKKFVLNKETEKQVADSATFVDEKSFTDVYYDTLAYSLIKSDIWLRARDGRFELKTFLKAPVDNSIDRYDEIEEEQVIRNKLSLPQEGEMKVVLQNAGFAPFCVCTTTRKNYKKDDFSVVLDSAEFDDGFTYRLGEIELLANDSNDIGKAAERITELARTMGLSETPPNGKIVAYLKEKRPEHYKAFAEMFAAKQ